MVTARSELLAAMTRLQAGEPPFSLRMPAPSLWRVPIVLESPHAGLRIPRSFTAWDRLTDAQKLRFLLPGDTYADLIVRGLIDPRAPKPLAVPALEMWVARSTVDAYRARNDLPERLAAACGGHAVPWEWGAQRGFGTIAMVCDADEGPLYDDVVVLTDEDARLRIEEVHDPYRAALARLVDRTRQRFGPGHPLLHVSVHDCARWGNAVRGGGFKLRPDVCIATGHGKSMPRELAERMAGVFSDHGFTTGIDDPFVGGDLTFTTADLAARVYSGLFEVCKAVFMDEESLELDRAALDRLVLAYRDALFEAADYLLTA